MVLPTKRTLMLFILCPWSLMGSQSASDVQQKVEESPSSVQKRVGETVKKILLADYQRVRDGVRQFNVSQNTAPLTFLRKYFDERVAKLDFVKYEGEYAKDLREMPKEAKWYEDVALNRYGKICFREVAELYPHLERLLQDEEDRKMRDVLRAVSVFEYNSPHEHGANGD